MVRTALQGAFVEHEASLRRIRLPNIDMHTTQVRRPEDLEVCDGLIIPGGGECTDQ